MLLFIRFMYLVPIMILYQRFASFLYLFALVSSSISPPILLFSVSPLSLSPSLTPSLPPSPVSLPCSLSVSPYFPLSYPLYPLCLSLHHLSLPYPSLHPSLSLPCPLTVSPYPTSLSPLPPLSPFPLSLFLFLSFSDYV